MSKRKGEPGGDKEQKAMDTEDILLAVNKWADAQAAVVAKKDELEIHEAKCRALKNDLKRLEWDALARWRALRRAQGYDAD